MGYRSCAAILMYGKKQDCEMVMNLFLCSGEIAQEDKDFFERNKQESNAYLEDYYIGSGRAGLVTWLNTFFRGDV